MLAFQEHMSYNSTFSCRIGNPHSFDNLNLSGIESRTDLMHVGKSKTHPNDVGTLLCVPFHGIIFAPLYLCMIMVKSVILILLNLKLEEVELCILEQRLQGTSKPIRSLVTTTSISFNHI